MLRKGIGLRQHSNTLARILNLSYSQAHRKLQGGVDWTLKQLNVVARYFDEPIESLGISVVCGQSRETGFKGVEATLHLIGLSRSFRCRASVGEEIRSTGATEFAAIKCSDAWQIVEIGESVPEIPSYRVIRIELLLKQRPRVKIGLQVNNRVLRHSLCEGLALEGLEPYVIERNELMPTIGLLDAYILEWPIDTGPQGHSIVRLRQVMGTRAPLYVISNPIRPASVDELSLIQLVADYGVFWREYPIRVGVLIAELKSLVGGER